MEGNCLRSCRAAVVVLLLSASVLAQSAPEALSMPEIRAQMEFLASDVLNGRASESRDEAIAAAYIASELLRYGVEPAAPGGGYIQQVDITLPDRLSQADPPKQRRYRTQNVIGILRGTDPTLAKDIILLSAHHDHVGRGMPKLSAPKLKDDDIYNGADDDASGVVAVLQLARALSAGPRPRRSVMFAFLGAEELGLIGAQYFEKHFPYTLDCIVANLGFEMIGRPDPNIAAQTLWFTGFDYSNLGPELARQGARLVADPYPKYKFFERSDNFTLAQQGIIAHTVSSYGLHKDYHSPKDEVERIDFPHMKTAIESMIQPVRWLANTDFKPAWNPGKNPKK
jgi:Zn-dependent M28 family amino/carboxypeptidase